MNYISLVIPFLLGWIFLTSALDKLWKRQEFQSSLGQYPLAHGRMQAILSRTIPILELSAGLALLLGFYGRAAAALAIGLLIAFTFAVSYTLSAGSSASCACGGLVPTKTYGRSHIIVNLVLLMSASYLLVSPHRGKYEIGTFDPYHIEVTQNWFALLTMAATLNALIVLAVALSISEARAHRVRIDTAVFDS